MVVLSYGYKKPENGDRGSVWFPALADNIDLMNDHDHDGSNSSLLSSSVITGGSVNVNAAGWTLVSTGVYSQTVSTPSGFNMTDHSLTVREKTSGDLAYPTIVKASNTTFTVFTNKNTYEYTVLFR